MKNAPQYTKESRVIRAERIRESGNTYCQKIKPSKKVFNKKDKSWKNEY